MEQLLLDTVHLFIDFLSQVAYFFFKQNQIVLGSFIFSAVMCSDTFQTKDHSQVSIDRTVIYGCLESISQNCSM